ncbi:MAG: MG2 domain-containing protein, partial [candidate division WOR-3 bacterium]
MEPIRDTKKADELFKKEVFESAIKEYEAILKEATDEDIRFKSFFRICESLTHLFRYGEASQRIMAAEQLPKSRKNQARFLLFKANLLENFLLQYGYIQRKDVVDEAKDKEDIFRWTPDEIHRLIHQTYQELLDFKDELLKMELKEEGYFLNLEKVDFGRYPTLFDFYILKWTKYLLSRNLTEVEDKPEIERFLVKDFNLPVNPQDSPLLLSAELMEEAGRNRSRQDLQAGEEWRMERVLLAEKYYDAFAYSDVEPDGTPKRGLSLADCMKKTIEYLLELMEDFKTAEAKAQAGYHAAIILKNQGQARAGVELCRRVERKFSNTDGARRARVLRREIEMPELSLATRMAMPPARRSLTIMVKNIKLVYLRLYKLDPDVLRAECEQYRQNEYGRNYYRYEGWSDILNGGFLNERWARDWLKNILTLVPLRTWQVDTGDRGDYLFHSMTIDPPDLGPGLYLIAVSKDDRFHVGGSLMSVSILNVTEIVLVGSSGLTEKSLKAYYEFIEGRGGMNIEDEGFRLYLLDGQTGKMIPDAQLMIDTYFYYRQDIKSLSLKTENDGCARLSIPVLAGPNQYNYNHIDPRANYKESCAFWYNRQALNHSFPNPFEIFIELDRPIYRPGHKVQAKAVVVRRTGQGFKSMDNGSIEFYATDPNHKEFFRTRAELNQFGSVGISFDIPAGRLLGRYILIAQFNYGTYQTAVGVPFSVEEYKRPEFEINLEPAGEPYQYGRPVKIKGCVRYYFGGPVPDAIVKYRIKRQPYIPWYYRYWFSQMNASFQELAGGEVKSDEEGNFEIEFIPRPHTENYCDLVPNISLFLVEVEARDSGGRTITACQTYRAGQRGSYFLIEPLKGFYFESEPVEIEIKMLTINDTPIEGQSRCEVYCLRDFLPPEPEYDNYGQWRNLPHLDDQLKDAPNGEMVFKGEALHNKEGRTVVRIAPLRAGAYRIIQRAIDRWGGEVIQSKVFVVVKDLKSPIPINALSIMLVEKEEYKVGETARFIIGSGLGSGRYLIEVWAGQYFLRKIFIDEDIPVRIFEIEVTEEMKGGFTLRWFGVRDLKIYYNQATVAVPWSEKRLQIALEPFKKILPPGQEIEWGMKITDIDNRPVRAEVLALMFDRSLEYYARGYSRWLNSLYSANPVPQGAFYSILAGLVKNVEITEGLLKKLLDSFRKGIQDFQLPDFRTRQTWAYVSRPGRRKIGRMVEQALPEAAPCESESRE